MKRNLLIGGCFVALLVALALAQARQRGGHAREQLLCADGDAIDRGGLAGALPPRPGDDAADPGWLAQASCLFARAVTWRSALA